MLTAQRSFALAFGSIISIAGCDNGPTALIPDSGPPDTPVTYYDDVRPILYDNCVQCHHEGGIAPFALLTYEDAREVSMRMAEVTLARIMPPYLADASGECNEFHNPRRLEDSEIDIIQRWVAQNTPEGDATLPEPPVRVLPDLASVDAVVDMGVEYDPDPALSDDYRCFVVEPTYTGTNYLTGYAVRPGNPRLVHHAIVFQPIDTDSGDEARALDAAEDGPGYTCFGDAVVFALPVAVWAPGAGATLFPEGTGIELHEDRPLILQIHYNTVLEEQEPDRTMVDFELATEVDRVAEMGMLANFNIALPPRMESVHTSTEGVLSFVPPGNLTVWGAFPHMHTMGRQLRVEVVGDEDRCVVDVPRWDFNWQAGYFYETPLEIAETDRLRIDCTYDTTERDETVFWGDRTEDEMCLSFFYVTPSLL